MSTPGGSTTPLPQASPADPWGLSVFSRQPNSAYPEGMSMEEKVDKYNREHGGFTRDCMTAPSAENLAILSRYTTNPSSVLDAPRGRSPQSTPQASRADPPAWVAPARPEDIDRRRGTSAGPTRRPRRRDCGSSQPRQRKDCHREEKAPKAGQPPGAVAAGTAAP